FVRVGRGEGEDEEGEGEDGDDTGGNKPDGNGSKSAGSGGSKSGGGGGGGGGGGFDALLDRGCKQVRGGDAANGVKTLLRAFDAQPNDLDVMVCLAQGYEKTGNPQSALTFYERVLSKSANHRVALRQAAALYDKRGS